MAYKLILFLAVMCFISAFAQVPSFAEEQKDDEYSSYSGLLNLVDTQRPEKPAKKTIIIHNSRMYIIELACTLKTTTHTLFNPIEKTEKTTGQSEKDSLSFYFLMDLKDKLLYIFDLDKTLIGSDSLKNKEYGVFFDVFGHEPEGSLYREVMDDSRIIAEKDTLLHSKWYKTVRIVHDKMVHQGSPISSVQYIDTSCTSDFPFYGKNILDRGFQGFHGGQAICIDD